MFAICNTVREQFGFSRIRHTGQNGVVVIKRNVWQRPVISFVIDWVNGADVVIASEFAPFMTLHTKTGDDNTHTLVEINLALDVG
jgi:hypothetical protein